MNCRDHCKLFPCAKLCPQIELWVNQDYRRNKEATRGLYIEPQPMPERKASKRQIILEAILIDRLSNERIVSMGYDIQLIRMYVAQLLNLLKNRQWK